MLRYVGVELVHEKGSFSYIFVRLQIVYLKIMKYGPGFRGMRSLPFQMFNEILSAHILFLFFKVVGKLVTNLMGIQLDKHPPVSIFWALCSK